MLGCKNLKLFAISLPQQCCNLCQYRRVYTSTILPNFTGNCRDSVVFALAEVQAKERAYVEEAYVRQVLSCFDLILLANQNNSPGQPKESLRVATAVRYNYYVQLVAIKARSDARTEFKILEHSLRGGGSWSCTKLYVPNRQRPKFASSKYCPIKISPH